MTKCRERKGIEGMKDEPKSAHKCTRECKVGRLGVKHSFLRPSVLLITPEGRPSPRPSVLLLSAEGEEEVIGVKIKIPASTLIAPWESQCLPRRALLPMDRRYNMKHKRKMEDGKNERLRGVRTREE